MVRGVCRGRHAVSIHTSRFREVKRLHDLVQLLGVAVSIHTSRFREVKLIPHNYRRQ